MTYQGFIKKSRTYDYGAFIAILGALQVGLSTVLVDWQVPQKWIGIILLLISMGIAFFRKITTGPVGEK